MKRKIKQLDINSFEKEVLVADTASCNNFRWHNFYTKNGVEVGGKTIRVKGFSANKIK